jgi:hypothetical protein
MTCVVTHPLPSVCARLRNQTDRLEKKERSTMTIPTEIFTAESMTQHGAVRRRILPTPLGIPKARAVINS